MKTQDEKESPSTLSEALKYLGEYHALWNKAVAENDNLLRRVTELETAIRNAIGKTRIGTTVSETEKLLWDALRDDSAVY